MATSTKDIWNDFSCAIKAYFLSQTNNIILADDLTQEVFIKIHSHIATLRNMETLKSWIYTIARNVLIDHMKKKSSHSETPSDSIVEKISEQVTGVQDYENTPVHELASQIRHIVDTLPEHYAEALSLVEFEGMTQNELAKHLGISGSGAKSRVQRARRMLRDNLLACCHFEFDRHGTIVDIYPRCCCCQKK